MSHRVRLFGISLCFMIVVSFSPALLPLGRQEKKPAKTLKHMEVDLGGGVKMKLVFIEPGKFMMGSPKEEEGRFNNELQHAVEISKGFWMGVFTVTREEHLKVIGKNTDNVKGARLPTEPISWEKTMEFCKRLSQQEGKTFDLPTEAEWEYACRAGSKGPFHYGNSLSSKQANFNGNFPYGGADKGPNLGKTLTVGSYEPNAFGLYDMHGNVLQWCRDWYLDDFYKDSPLQDPQGPAKGTSRVLRGGSWASSARTCRSACRGSGQPGGILPGGKGGPYGFRVVMRLP